MVIDYFIFFAHITPSVGIYLIRSSFYFLQKFLEYKAKVSCFIGKRPLRNIIYSAGPQIFSEYLVAETHILVAYI